MIFTRAQLVHELGLIVMSCESRAYEAGEEPTKAMWEKRASVGQAILRLLEHQPFTQAMVDALKEAQESWLALECDSCEGMDAGYPLNHEGPKRKYDTMTEAIERMQSLVNSH